MATSYKVRIWAIRTHKNKTKKDTYSLRWVVEGAARPFCRSFDVKAMAEAFRARLVTAKSTGEAFDLAEGLPVSALRERRDGKTWYEVTVDYVDLKVASPRSRLPPHTRRVSGDGHVRAGGPEEGVYDSSEPLLGARTLGL